MTRLDPQKETDIVRDILEYLSYRRIVAWRNNSGAVKYEGKGRTRYVRFGLVGSSDIIGILPDGRFLGIEVKSSSGVTSEAQAAFLDVISKSNGIAFVARSVDDVIAKLDSL